VYSFTGWPLNVPNLVLERILNKIASSYIAGLMDGEGTFYIEKFAYRKSAIGFQYRPIVSLSMCDEITVRFVASETGKSVRSWQIKSGRTVFRIDWRNEIACDFIRHILPFMLGKREQAELLLEFNKSVAPGRGHAYVQEDFAKCEFYYRKLKSLKQVGLRC
jgi:hypothetical protein